MAAGERDRILKIMEMKSLTAAQLADEAGIARSALSHILNGRNRPSLDILQRIKGMYPELSSDWLFLGLGEPTGPYQVVKEFVPPKKDSGQPTGKPKSEGAQAGQNEGDANPSILPDSGTGQAKHSDNEKYRAVVEQVIVVYSNGTFRSYRPQ